MKKIVSISFLCLLLYNMFSTGIVLLCFDKSIQKATPITQNDEWLEIKMPIALPYSSDFANITSHEGLIEYQGEFYNIIEQRYSNDTLYTKIKTNHKAKQKYQSISEELSQQFSDNHSEKNSPLKKALDLCKHLSSNYLPQKVGLENKYLHFIESKKQSLFYYSYLYAHLYTSGIFMPPEIASV
ncbi:hypothetical protein [Flectobacillus roseus]|uniref:hypothetical protein n=1 Tax=Flectobacillus roseus TaxID=502259 RepID=UPI0024B7BAD8|nr:hypothetical protein [Flectobacillus roseus]MDI9870837.1 hypothetical protein [Flectobacillus roseus]